MKRRDDKEMQDSLVLEEGMMVKFPLIPLPLVSLPCISCFKVLSAKKKLNNHIVEIHKDPTSFNIYVPPEAPYHLPLATLPCSTAQCNHCSKNFSIKSSLSKHMLVVHGAGSPSKILQNRYLAKLMARMRISFAICYINF